MEPELCVNKVHMSVNAKFLSKLFFSSGQRSFEKKKNFEVKIIEKQRIEKFRHTDFFSLQWKIFFSDEIQRLLCFIHFFFSFW